MRMVPAFLLLDVTRAAEYPADDGKNASTEGEQKSLRRVGKKRTVPERSYEQWAQQEREQQGRGAGDNQRHANRVQSGVPV